FHNSKPAEGRPVHAHSARRENGALPDQAMLVQTLAAAERHGHSRSRLDRIVQERNKPEPGCDSTRGFQVPEPRTRRMQGSHLRIWRDETRTLPYRSWPKGMKAEGQALG